MRKIGLDPTWIIQGPVIDRDGEIGGPRDVVVVVIELQVRGFEDVGVRDVAGIDLFDEADAVIEDDVAMVFVIAFILGAFVQDEVGGDVGVIDDFAGRGIIDVLAANVGEGGEGGGTIGFASQPILGDGVPVLGGRGDHVGVIGEDDFIAGVDRGRDGDAVVGIGVSGLVPGDGDPGWTSMGRVVFDDVALNIGAGAGGVGDRFVDRGQCAGGEDVEGDDAGKRIAFGFQGSEVIDDDFIALGRDVPIAEGEGLVREGISGFVNEFAIDGDVEDAISREGGEIQGIIGISTSDEGLGMLDISEPIIGVGDRGEVKGRNAEDRGIELDVQQNGVVVFADGRVVAEVAVFLFGIGGGVEIIIQDFFARFVVFDARIGGDGADEVARAGDQIGQASGDGAFGHKPSQATPHCRGEQSDGSQKLDQCDHAEHLGFGMSLRFGHLGRKNASLPFFGNWLSIVRTL